MPRARMRPEVKARLVDAVQATPGKPDRGSGAAVVVDIVRQWIFDGLLRDGDTISQGDLADVLGLSRVPVRDGLIALAGTGWVLMEPDRGARAVGLDAAAIRDSLDLFGSIWALLIRRAVERAGDPAPLVASGRRVKIAHSPTEMTEANDAFVLALKVLAAAPRLDAAFTNAARVVPRNFFAVVPDAVAVQRRHVPRIAAAIVDGDVATGAALAASQHRTHAESITRLLRGRGVIT